MIRVSPKYRRQVFDVVNLYRDIDTIFTHVDIYIIIWLCEA